MLVSAEERTRTTLILETRSRKRYWLEVEVREDPRNPQRLILCFYDVTEIHHLRDQVNRGEYVKIVGRSQPMLKMFETFDRWRIRTSIMGV